MIELWAILTITAAFIWTFVSLIDKFVLSKEMHDPILATIIGGATLFALSLFLLIFERNIFISYHLILIALIAGIIYNFSMYFYYSAIKTGEVSRVISFISISPLFVLAFAFFFLDERLTMLNYVGVCLMVLGSFLISIKKEHSKYFFSKALVIALIAALFLALRDLSVKFATLQTSIWPILFWVGVGGGLVAIFLLIKHHPHVRKKGREGIRDLIVGRTLSAISVLIFLFAVSLTSVSLVSALVKIEVVFVFIFATVLSYFHSRFIREKLNVKILLQKFVSITLILIGVFLII